jgi:hypothetical protein
MPDLDRTPLRANLCGEDLVGKNANDARVGASIFELHCAIFQTEHLQAGLLVDESAEDQIEKPTKKRPGP